MLPLHFVMRRFVKQSLLMSLIFSAFALVAASVQAEPDERLSASIKRDAASAPQFALVFKKNIYRVETWEHEYAVQVPYEEQETTTTYEPVTKTEWLCGDDPANPAACTWKEVTSYEWVTRTVTVTKYRTEWRCCETSSMTVYDHTWTQNVTVEFPPETALLPGEKERIGVRLAGDEGAPQVKIDSSEAIFRYKVDKAEVRGGRLEVTLACVPFLSESLTGPKSIGSAAVEFDTKSVTVKIQDKMTNPRVASTYKIAITERGGTTPIAQTETVTRNGVLVTAKLDVELDADKDYTVLIGVSRNSFMMPKPVSFSLERKIPAEALDRKKIADRGLVHHFFLDGTLDATKFGFRDDSPAYRTVKTEYAFRVSVITKNGAQVIAEKRVDRQSLVADKKKNLLVALRDLGATDEALKTLVKRTKLKVDIEVLRSSKRIGQVKFARKAELRIER